MLLIIDIGLIAMVVESGAFNDAFGEAVSRYPNCCVPFIKNGFGFMPLFERCFIYRVDL